jgi:hypothetical protein
VKGSRSTKGKQRPRETSSESRSPAFSRFVKRLLKNLNNAGIGRAYEDWPFGEEGSCNIASVCIEYGKCNFSSTVGWGYETDINLAVDYKRDSPFTSREWLLALETCNELAVEADIQCEELLEPPVIVKKEGMLSSYDRFSVDSDRQVSGAIIWAVDRLEKRILRWNALFVRATRKQRQRRTRGQGS